MYSLFPDEHQIGRQGVKRGEEPVNTLYGEAALLWNLESLKAWASKLMKFIQSKSKSCCWAGRNSLAMSQAGL